MGKFAVATVLPALAGDRARVRFLEWFTAPIRNPNTQHAYAGQRKGFDLVQPWPDRAFPTGGAKRAGVLPFWLFGCL